ncbi:MAG: AAA family ATPase [Oscillospiraceae bacterium]|nr:AAA family ATPase [Oscillospiraceae bacterium]
MKLLQLTLNNFQGIKTLTFDFEGGKSASIYGDNATGKTTVYNAITWLLFDKASTAAKNYTPKTKGPDGDLHNLEHSSEGIFEMDNGRIVTLKKTFREVYKKKRGSAHEEFDGHTVEYSVDGVPVKEKEFTATVLAFCGGDQEKPKMLTMPDYFPEQLAWDTRRKILLEICGDISDEEIIAANRDLRELPDFLRMPGTAEQYHTPEEYRKVATAKKADINKQLDGIPARIDEAERAIPDTAGLNAEEIEANIAALSKKLDDLAVEKATAATGGTATAELQKRIAELKTQIAEGRAAHAQRQADQNSDVDADILLAKKEAREEERKVEDCDIDIRRKSAEILRLTQLRDGLLGEYQRVSTETWDESQSVCPTCHQALPEAEIERMREEFNLRKSKKLEDINLRGKTEASKSVIAALEKEVEDLKATREAAAGRAKEAAERAERLAAQRIPATPYEQTEEYAALTAQIAEIEEKIADEGKCTAEAVNAVEAKIRAVKDATREEQDKQMQLTMAENQRRRISELERQEERLSGEYEELEKGLYLCDLFTKAKVAALTDRINGKFKSVRFRLFQEQLNGGLKEDCEVMIPTADGRMVPYTFANNAARINAGLEIIGTLSEHWGLKMPVFIDNAESVTHLTQTSTQTIRLVVSEADKKLRMEVEHGADISN